MRPYIAKLISKNKLTLPNQVVAKMGSATYFNIEVQDHKLILNPARVRPYDAALASVRDKIRKLGMRADVVSEAVRWARRKV